MKLHYGLSDLKNIDLTPFIPIIVISFIITLIALIDLIANRKRRKNFTVWLLIVILGNVMGSVIYFIAGRKD